jgi:hypothetical protein
MQGEREEKKVYWISTCLVFFAPRLELGVARFFFVKHTKTGKNVPKEHKIYQMAIKYT